MIRNNITRFLDKRNIDYTTFELPKEKLGALKTAELLNVNPDIVFKTIVVVRTNPGKPILAVVPGSKEVDLKALAKFVGEKKLKIPTMKEAEQLTGYQAGGISPLAFINRGFIIVIDESAKQHNKIHVSGGERGLNIRLQTSDLVKLTSAKLAKISK